MTVGYAIKGIGDAALIFNMLNGEDAAKTTNSNINISAGLRGYKAKGAGDADLGYTFGFSYGMTSTEPDGGEAQETAPECSGWRGSSLAPQQEHRCNPRDRWFCYRYGRS